MKVFAAVAREHRCGLKTHSHVLCMQTAVSEFLAHKQEQIHKVISVRVADLAQLMPHVKAAPVRSKSGARAPVALAPCTPD